MAFSRQPNERINELITRFEISHNRAVEEAGFQMSYEGLTLMILKAVGPSDAQLLQILHPLDQQFPTTQAHFFTMLQTIRRMGHILEHSPGNLASALGGSRTAHFVQNAQAEHAEAQTAHAFVVGASPGDNTNHSTWDSGYWNTTAEDAMVQSYLGNTSAPPDSGASSLGDTDTDTSSESYQGEIEEDPGIAGLEGPALGEAVFWAYKQAKRRWRRFSQKTTRKTRRFVKKRFGKRKGRGKGARHYLVNEGNPCQDIQAFLSRRGKGKGRRSTSGKGFNHAFTAKRK